MAKVKTKYICQGCGYDSPKWYGKCPGCNEWNKMKEEMELPKKTTMAMANNNVKFSNKKPVKLSTVSSDFLQETFSTGISEFDRVLGGKAVKGSLILLGGEPGKGKSTLLLQATENMSKTKNILYVSGEEAEAQLKLRSDRMGLKGEFNVVFSRNLHEILESALEIKSNVMIIDSINTVADPDCTGKAGGTAQIGACTDRLMEFAKENGVTIFIVAQVTKDGEIKGPKQLEHMVDTVLFLEGEKFSDLRLVRCFKNRFGSDSELGVFRMVGNGLEEVPNPSDYLLANRPEKCSGSGIVCISDSRPLLVEVQALASGVYVQGIPPRRQSEGFSRNRLNMLITVLEKRCNLDKLPFFDVNVNVVGGMKVDEPGADLGVAMTIYSSVKNQVIKPNLVMIGEVGLAGEVRPVARMSQLVNEIKRVGFEEVIVPIGSYEELKDFNCEDFKVTPVRTLSECVKALF